VLAQNNLLAFPYRHGFTVRALTRLLDEQGFQLHHVHGDVLVPIADEWTKPWARVEETLIKGAMAAVARRDGARRAPWLDVYAVRRDS
jgi:hypothetical protein